MENMLDSEWNSFLSNQDTNQYNFTSLTSNYNDNSGLIDTTKSEMLSTEITPIIQGTAPKCQDLYISTTTKVLFLNQPIDIQNIYWKLPITSYWKPDEGVLKKQIKIVSTSKEDLEVYKKKLTDVTYYNETIIKQIDNPEARRVKFKDERKITIGISKKDIMTCRCKVKNAFYNCFALILRFKLDDDVFHEIHVKVFNTGKLEIPGVLNNEILHKVKEMVLELLIPHINTSLSFLYHDIESNVLINSNFNCGFYINRDILQSILRSSKYNIETSYDPCSYPGVKCKFYFNHDIGFNTVTQLGQIVHEDRNMKMCELGDNIKYSEISFMIFRTGSCLIVGNCTKRILTFVYDFIKKILHDEYHNICVQNVDTEPKIKKVKIRKKTIILTKDYYNEIIA